MKTGSTKYAMLLFFALCSITAGRGMAQSAQDYLPGIQSVLPNSWTCRISVPSDSMDWPRGLNKPLFSASFVDTIHLITDCHSQSEHPGLTICFYADSLRETIKAVIKQQSIYSWCIPIKYLESPEYFIVTSPCYINNGCFTPEANMLIAPLDSVLADYFNQMPAATRNSSFTKPLVRKSAAGAGTRVLANGRVVDRANNNRPSATGLRFGDRKRVQVLFK